mmetsp:Transcript_38749/g.91786  ORF Transcript_38749/g.91786 Transcript_38749/m.91786 type:complete len:236 (-) Transcript_38749:2100-2807(-)
MQESLLSFQRAPSKRTRLVNKYSGVKSHKLAPAHILFGVQTRTSCMGSSRWWRCSADQTRTVPVARWPQSVTRSLSVGRTAKTLSRCKSGHASGSLCPATAAPTGGGPSVLRPSASRLAFPGSARLASLWRSRSPLGSSALPNGTRPRPSSTSASSWGGSGPASAPLWPTKWSTARSRRRTLPCGWRSSRMTSSRPGRPSRQKASSRSRVTGARGCCCSGILRCASRPAALSRTS